MTYSTEVKFVALIILSANISAIINTIYYSVDASMVHTIANEATELKIFEKC